MMMMWRWAWRCWRWCMLTEYVGSRSLEGPLRRCFRKNHSPLMTKLRLRCTPRSTNQKPNKKSIGDCWAVSNWIRQDLQARVLVVFNFSVACQPLSFPISKPRSCAEKCSPTLITEKERCSTFRSCWPCSGFRLGWPRACVCGVPNSKTKFLCMKRAPETPKCKQHCRLQPAAFHTKTERL